MASKNEQEIVQALVALDGAIASMTPVQRNAARASFERPVELLGDCGYCIRRGHEIGKPPAA